MFLPHSTQPSFVCQLTALQPALYICSISLSFTVIPRFRSWSCAEQFPYLDTRKTQKYSDAARSAPGRLGTLLFLRLAVIFGIVRIQLRRVVRIELLVV